MQSVETIRELSRQQAILAAEMDQKPLSVWPEDIESGDISGIPFLGDYLPDGYARDTLQPEYDKNPNGVYMGDNDGYGAFMVDSSGFGSRGEPALTIAEFIERLTPGYYAIVEAGQFQVKVGKFRKMHKGETKACSRLLTDFTEFKALL